MSNQELETRIALRLDTKNKNKTISKLARRNGENYQDIFSCINKALFGDYFMEQFNNVYNNKTPSSDKPLKTTRKSILDYVDSVCLEYYLDCANYIINQVTKNNCSVMSALEKITPKAKVMLEIMHPNKVVLQKSIAYETTKRAKQIKKGVCKEVGFKPATSNLEMQETYFEEAVDNDYVNWINSKEYKDYMIEENERD